MDLKIDIECELDFCRFYVRIISWLMERFLGGGNKDKVGFFSIFGRDFEGKFYGI